MATAPDSAVRPDGLDGPPTRFGRMRCAFRSLRMRNYRLYAGAELISITGTWVQVVAENWLVIRLTGSGLALGITTALQFLPLALAAPYGGVLVDRKDKRRLLVVTQTCAGLLSAVTGTLILVGLIRIWMVFVAALVLGLVNAVDDPARQAFTLEMVGPRDVANAVALNNSISMGGRAFGPALSGFLIAVVGLGWAFIFNALTYGAVALALLLVRRAELFRAEPITRRPRQIREGLSYAMSSTPIRTVLLVLAVVATFGFNFQIFLSLLVAQTFGRGAESYGFLMSAMGLGAMLGAMVAAAGRDPTVGRVRLLAIVFGTSLGAVGLVPTLVVGYLAAALMGAAASMFLSASAGSLQLLTDNALRGRVMALYTIGFLGTAPLGGPAMGYVAQVLSPRAALLLGGAASILASLFRPGRNRKKSPAPV